MKVGTSAERDALDQALQEVGEDIVLRRPSGTAPSDKVVECTVRGHIRDYRLRTENVVNGIHQQVWLVTISPTQIFATNWPNASSDSPDPQLPRRLDEMVFRGTVHTIEGVSPFYVDNELVRINLNVLG